MIKEYIIDLYKALECFDCDQVMDIYYAVKNGDISVTAEDIVPMCKMFTYKFQDTQPENDQLIIKMTFDIIDRCGVEMGLQEFVKGLQEIYDVSMADYGDRKQRGFTYEGLIDYIKYYINAFIAFYDDAHMILLGRMIKENGCSGFRERIVQIMAKDLECYEDDYSRKYKQITEDIVGKEKLLIASIKS